MMKLQGNSEKMFVCEKKNIDNIESNVERVT